MAQVAAVKQDATAGTVEQVVAAGSVLYSVENLLCVVESDVSISSFCRSAC